VFFSVLSYSAKDGLLDTICGVANIDAVGELTVSLLIAAEN
jgi:hypothetical protein